MDFSDDPAEIIENDYEQNLYTKIEFGEKF